MASFNYTEIENYCNEMGVISKDLLEAVADYDNIYLPALFNSGYWSGKAADYFADKLLKTDIINEIYQELQYAIMFLMRVSKDYEEIDKTIVKQVCENLGFSEMDFSGSKIFPNYK